MLAVPLKVSGKAPEWSEVLAEHIAKNFGGPAVAAEFARDVSRLATTRARAATVTAPDANSVAAVKSYLVQVRQVEDKFPSLRGGEGQPEWRRLVFAWNDAFRPKKTLTQTDAEFERACVYFNLGALESLAGMQQDRSTVEGTKAALAHFQSAAGVFGDLLDGIHGTSTASSSSTSATDGAGDAPPSPALRDFHVKGPLTSDLSFEGLSMLKSLMLAQAQVCYVEKATKDGLKPSVLSKLAVEASKLYDAALTMTRTPTLSAVLDKAWAAYIEFHKKEYEAWAEFYAAQGVHQKADETGTGYGEEIARLRRAATAAQAAADTATRLKLPTGVLTAMSSLARKVHAEEAKAIDDNNKIYMNPVPDASSLALPAGALLAKAVPPALNAAAANAATSTTALIPLFHNLLPPWARTAEAQFQSKLSAMVKEFGDKIETRASDVRMQLAEAGLPAAVESSGGASAGPNVPDLAWKRIVDNVLNVGGVPTLLSDAAANRAANDRAVSALDQIESLLADEERQDAAARARFPDMGGQPSAVLNATMRADVATFRHQITEARRADDVLAAQLRAAAPALELLSKSREQLAGWLPPDGAAEADQDPAVEQARVELSMLLVNLGIKVQELEVAQASLVERAADDSIAKKLTAPDSVQNAMSDAIAQYRGLTGDIEAKLASLNAIFNQVLEKNHAFARMRHQNEASRKREAALIEIEQATSKFTELLRMVSDGSRFYEVMVSRVAQLKVLVDDFCFVRKEERQELETAAASRRSPSSSVSVGGAAADGGGFAPVAYSANNWEPPTIMGTHSQASSTTPAPHRSPPPAPALVVDPVLASLPAERVAAVDAMRDILALPPSAAVGSLVPFLQKANWDVNEAVNQYIEQGASLPPPSASSLSSSSSRPMAVATPVPAQSQAAQPPQQQTRKKSGWFR